MEKIRRPRRSVTAPNAPFRRSRETNRSQKKSQKKRLTAAPPPCRNASLTLKSDCAVKAADCAVKRDEQRRSSRFDEAKRCSHLACDSFTRTPTVFRADSSGAAQTPAIPAGLDPVHPVTMPAPPATLADAGRFRLPRPADPLSQPGAPGGNGGPWSVNYEERTKP